MTNSSKILKIKDSKFYYTENDFIDIKDTNIPYRKLSFSRGHDIFWEVELFNYDIENKTIRVRVLNYSPEDTLSFYKQKQKKSVNTFLFEKFDWTRIEPQLSSYQISELHTIIKDIPSTDTRYTENLEGTEKFVKPNSNPLKEFESSIFDESNELLENQFVKISNEFSFYYKNADFKDGFVIITVKPKLCSKKEEIKIFNNNLLSEYQYIRNYFPKYFKKGKKFNVRLSGEVQFGKLITYDATSDEIQSINEKVISEVRNLIDIELFDTVAINNKGKNVLSIDEILEKSELNITIKGSINKEPQKLLQTIIKIKNVKNKKQLEYLAGFKQKGNFQIRFTLKPLFGFLFYMESANEKHFCWELLNSHATYIWSFDSKYDFSERLDDIDEIINYIKINGRKEYKHHAKLDSENDIIFRTIYHKNRLTNFKDGFIDWKNELEQILNKTSG